MDLPKQSKILFTVLNWGLGHATRSIPLINKLLQNNNVVYIASDGEALTLLQNHFPQLHLFNLPSYNITYSKSTFQNFKLIVQVPKILKTIKKEHQITQTLCSEYNFDFIFSDNRYGTYHSQIKSVFICHQLSLQVPFAKSLMQKIHSLRINKFANCWIPCDEHNNLIPQLTNNPYIKIPKKFIGYLSRWEGKKFDKQSVKKFIACAVISGPEPQRSIFEQKCIQLFSKYPQYNFAVVGGVFKTGEVKIFDNIMYFKYLNNIDLWNLINQSNQVISRSGYTSVMDYLITDTPVIYIPTPGQSEQEYIANQLKIIQLSKVINQEKVLTIKF
ncbi:MAG: hypothetical protein RLZZ414_1982 [Bacteroidota bacterium]|jgi:uncharacterized protein (TIGR00661 family)